MSYSAILTSLSHLRRSPLPVVSRCSLRRRCSWDRRYVTILGLHLPTSNTVCLLHLTTLEPVTMCVSSSPHHTQLTVIQGDISELTVDCVVHPTNASFNLTGLCGKYQCKEGRRGRGRGEGGKGREEEGEERTKGGRDLR